MVVSLGPRSLRFPPARRSWTTNSVALEGASATTRTAVGSTPTDTRSPGASLVANELAT